MTYLNIFFMKLAKGSKAADKLLAFAAAGKMVKEL